MDRKQIARHVRSMSAEQFADIYYPIFQELTDQLSDLNKEHEKLKLQKTEQDKHYDKLLLRIKTIATE